MGLSTARGVFGVTAGAVGSTINIETGISDGVVFFYYTRTTSAADIDASGVGFQSGFGVALSASSRRCLSGMSNDADTMTSINQANIRDDSCIHIFTEGIGTPATDGIADFNGFGYSFFSIF